MSVGDPDTGALLHTLVEHVGRVWAVAVSADGRLPVSGGRDGTVRLWDLAQGWSSPPLSRGNRITGIAATPTGRRVIAGTETGPGPPGTIPE